MRTSSLVLSLAVVLALSACSPTSPIGTPSPSPDEPVAAGAWGIAGDRAAFDDPLGFSEIADVEQFGDGYIAVGGDARGAATWRSDDGLGWTKSPADPDLAFGLMRGVLRAGSGLLGWGVLQPEPFDENPAIWHSADGTDWQRIEGLPDNTIMRGLAVAPGGWLAFLVPDDGNGLLVQASPDGIDWTAAPNVVAPDRILHAVAAGPGGFWAAFSSEAGLSIWHSATGLDWAQQATISTQDGGPVISSMAVIDATIVAVGSVNLEAGEPNALAWLSRDAGRTWTTTPIAPEQPSYMHRVEPFDSGFVAIGMVSGGLDDAQSIAWSSQDGRSWRRLGLGPRDSRVSGLSNLGDRILAWGVDREASARVWSSPAPNPSFSDVPSTVVECPATAPTFRDAVLVPSANRLACIGSAPVAGRAFLLPTEGGNACSDIEPLWLSCGASAYLTADAGPRVRGMPVVFDPAATFDARAGTWYELTGQLDHPAAQTCAASVPVDAAEASRIIAACRATFVVTEIGPAAGP